MKRDGTAYSFDNSLRWIRHCNRTCEWRFHRHKYQRHTTHQRNHQCLEKIYKSVEFYTVNLEDAMWQIPNDIFFSIFSLVQLTCSPLLWTYWFGNSRRWIPHCSCTCEWRCHRHRCPRHMILPRNHWCLLDNVHIMINTADPSCNSVKTLPIRQKKNG